MPQKSNKDLERENEGLRSQLDRTIHSWDQDKKDWKQEREEMAQKQITRSAVQQEICFGVDLLLLLVDRLCPGEGAGNIPKWHKVCDEIGYQSIHPKPTPPVAVPLQEALEGEPDDLEG
jgi:hypothetical protein